MKRKCVKFDLEKFKEDNQSTFKHVDIISVELYIDIKIKKEFDKIIEENKSKFRSIIYYILQGKYNNELYGKENVSEKAKNITAMKFKKALNGRVYCKEIFVGNKKIVAVHILPNKDFQSASQKSLKPKLESIGGYEYEFKEEI